MTVLPGSLNYLYYNGIIDHIPTEAYMQPMMPFSRAYCSPIAYPNMGIVPVQSGILPANSIVPRGQYRGGIGEQYIGMASTGALYNTGNSPDAFIGSYNNPYNNSPKSFFKEKFDTKDILKGIVALGALILTPVLLWKGGKKLFGKTPEIKVEPQNKGFLSKLNPKNWRIIDNIRNRRSNRQIRKMRRRMNRPNGGSWWSNSKLNPENWRIVDNIRNRQANRQIRKMRKRMNRPNSGSWWSNSKLNPKNWKKNP